MISYKLIPGVGCEISIDGKHVDTVAIKGYVARLVELGYKAPKAETTRRQNGYGWSQSGRRAA